MLWEYRWPRLLEHRSKEKIRFRIKVCPQRSGFGYWLDKPYESAAKWRRTGMASCWIASHKVLISNWVIRWKLMLRSEFSVMCCKIGVKDSEFRMCLQASWLKKKMLESSKLGARRIHIIQRTTSFSLHKIFFTTTTSSTNTLEFNHCSYLLSLLIPITSTARILQIPHTQHGARYWVSYHLWFLNTELLLTLNLKYRSWNDLQLCGKFDIPAAPIQADHFGI